MITTFKKFEAYSGGGKAIGFRYSSPKENEQNHYNAAFIVKKGDDDFVPGYNQMMGIESTVDILPIKTVVKKLKDSLEKVDIEYKDVTYETIKKDIYAILIDFYCYSKKEAEVILRNLGYVIDMSGYEVADLRVGGQGASSEQQPKRMGFKYPGADEEEDIPTMASGAYGSSFPNF